MYEIISENLRPRTQWKYTILFVKLFSITLASGLCYPNGFCIKRNVCNRLNSTTFELSLSTLQFAQVWKREYIQVNFNEFELGFTSENQLFLPGFTKLLVKSSYYTRSHSEYSFYFYRSWYRWLLLTITNARANQIFVFVFFVVFNTSWFLNMYT